MLAWLRVGASCCSPLHVENECFIIGVSIALDATATRNKWIAAWLERTGSRCALDSTPTAPSGHLPQIRPEHLAEYHDPGDGFGGRVGAAFPVDEEMTRAWAFLLTVTFDSLS